MNPKPDIGKPNAKPSKQYEKPTLIKGPVLASVAAATTVSGIPSDLQCWVARAAFGATDLRWMIFRGWLLDDAPRWFLRFYMRRGESVGAWLTHRPLARCFVRQMMMPAIRRKLRSIN